MPPGINDNVKAPPSSESDKTGTILPPSTSPKIQETFPNKSTDKLSTKGQNNESR